MKARTEKIAESQGMNARRLLIAYGLVNAVLYSLLLPLWEGFDEPLHFGYVQQFANGQALPDPRRARLSSEVGTSILLAPASQVVKQNLPQVMSYAEYFSLPAPKRAELRRQLDEIPWKGVGSPHSSWITKRTIRRWHMHYLLFRSDFSPESRFQFESRYCGSLSRWWGPFFC